MELTTTTNVSSIFLDCLFRDGEDTADHVLAEGITMAVGFHPQRLEAHKESIGQLVHELPDVFKPGGGGGFSFLGMCMDRHNRLWGEQENVQQLVLLGLAAGHLVQLTPRFMWPMLPGGVPYYAVVEPEEVRDGN